MPSLCRDCNMLIDGQPARCPHCSGPQVLSHDELNALNIAHIDCDAFYAAVEKRDDPSIRDKPVIIGGRTRGVVTTACYIARIRGVRSAMPMFQAIQRCPDAVIIKPNMQKYAEVGGQIREYFRRLTPKIQPLSIDESFLDLTPVVEQGRHAAQELNWLGQKLLDDIGISISIGLSYNKLMAKIASDLDKPAGFSVLGRQDGPAFLAQQSVKILWGVGPASARRMNALGIKTVGQLKAIPKAEMHQRFGKFGDQLYDFARGVDHRRVGGDSAGRKTVSTETTFGQNIHELPALIEVLERLSERLEARLARASLKGRSLTLKLKTADFQNLTRSVTVPAPLAQRDEILRAALPLLEKTAHGQHFRLMGLGLSGFDEHSGTSASRRSLKDQELESEDASES